MIPSLAHLPGYPAAWSTCKRYRYTLWRTWEPDIFRKPGPFRYQMVIGLNPSTATEDEDDPTVRRCWERARRLGFDAMVMTNIFAFRATDPEDMKAEAEPIGPDNDKWLKRIAAEAAQIVVAWGSHGVHLDRDEQILSFLEETYALDVNSNGTPKHPLYVRSDQPLRLYKKP